MMKKEINKYTPNPKQSMRRQQRGNTLVPVLLGLGIAAVATVSFLNQGEGLIDDNNRVLAVNEVSSILKDYNAIRATGTDVDDVTNVMVPGFNAANIYGIANNAWTAANGAVAGRIFSYSTDSAQTCRTLLATFNGADGVTPPADGAANTTNCGTAAAGANDNDGTILNLLLN
jgi:hypothetical protein